MKVKSFEINCYFFPEYKERLKSSLCAEKALMKSLKRSAGNSS
jgi:hypothetical protein